jgi:hypothetical protein
MAIPLVNKEDVIVTRGTGSDSVKRPKEKENIGTTIAKKKSEKPVRILRIRYYEKISMPFAKNGKLEQVDVVAVNRGLGDLLKDLGYNINIQGTTTSHDCILVEKGSKMGIGNKFIFVDIGTNDFYSLKKQMENHTTICAYNQGEFMILDGKRTSLNETFNIPKTWKDKDNDNEKVHISDTNKLVLREKLRSELKGILKPYHSYEDDQIDRMKESELVQLKKLASRKMNKDDINRKFYEDLLK